MWLASTYRAYRLSVHVQGRSIFDKYANRSGVPGHYIVGGVHARSRISGCQKRVSVCWYLADREGNLLSPAGLSQDEAIPLMDR